MSSRAARPCHLDGPGGKSYTMMGGGPADEEDAGAQAKLQVLERLPQFFASRCVRHGYSCPKSRFLIRLLGSAGVIPRMINSLFEEKELDEREHV